MLRRSGTDKSKSRGRAAFARGPLVGLLLLASLSVTKVAAVNPPPQGIPGYSAGPSNSVILGYTAPVVAGYRAPVFTGPGTPLKVRNAAPSVPGYVATIRVPAAAAAPVVAGYAASVMAAGAPVGAGYAPQVVPGSAPQQVVVAGYAPAPVVAGYAPPVVAGYAPRPAPARAAFYNPVGFGFGGYSYGEYPAYGFNGYLPAAYDGFNVSGYESRAVTTAGYRGAATASPGGYSTFNMSDTWTGYCGPNGCRMGYRAWEK